jgi:hypothetical protein
MRVYTSRCGKSAMGFIHHVPHMGAGVCPGNLALNTPTIKSSSPTGTSDVGAGLVTLLMLPEPVSVGWLIDGIPGVDSWRANAACGSSEFHLATAGAVGTSGLGRHAVGHSCRPIQRLIDRRTTLKRICRPVHRSAA